MDIHTLTRMINNMDTHLAKDGIQTCKSCKLKMECVFVPR